MSDTLGGRPRQLCQGWGREFESLRPLQILDQNNGLLRAPETVSGLRPFRHRLGKRWTSSVRQTLASAARLASARNVLLLSRFLQRSGSRGSCEASNKPGYPMTSPTLAGPARPVALALCAAASEPLRRALTTTEAAAYTGISVSTLEKTPSSVRSRRASPSTPPSTTTPRTSIPRSSSGSGAIHAGRSTSRR